MVEVLTDAMTPLEQDSPPVMALCQLELCVGLKTIAAVRIV